MISNFKSFPYFNILQNFVQNVQKTKKNLCPELYKMYRWYIPSEMFKAVGSIVVKTTKELVPFRAIHWNEVLMFKVQTKSISDDDNDNDGG